MTTQGDFTITINASPETVWKWVGDLSTHDRWSPHDYRVECVAGEPNTVGSTYRSVGWVPGDKSHKNEVEITEAVPNERLVLRAHDDQGDFTNTFTLTPVPGGTQVDYRIVFPAMTGMSAVLVPVAFPLLGKPDIRKRMAMLKAAVETSA